MEKPKVTEYLEKILPFEASKLVGKCMKRFDLFDNKDVLKKEIKEIIYEFFRDFITTIDAYEKGVETTYFQFIKREDK